MARILSIIGMKHYNTVAIMGMLFFSSTDCDPHELAASMEKRLKTIATDILLHDYNEDYDYDKLIQHLNRVIPGIVGPLLDVLLILAARVHTLEVELGTQKTQNMTEHGIIFLQLEGGRSSIENGSRELEGLRDDHDETSRILVTHIGGN